MSYLNDPRVFLATERTLLAWIRTEISIIALLFIMKKFGYDENLSKSMFSIDTITHIICYIVIGLAVLATLQAYLTLSKLGPQEIPSKIAKPMVLLSGFISILICTGSSLIILSL
jgi:putative membrane protein